MTIELQVVAVRTGSAGFAAPLHGLSQASYCFCYMPKSFGYVVHELSFTAHPASLLLLCSY